MEIALTETFMRVLLGGSSHTFTKALGVLWVEDKLEATSSHLLAQAALCHMSVPTTAFFTYSNFQVLHFMTVVLLDYWVISSTLPNMSLQT